MAHFIDINQISTDDLREIIELAKSLKLSLKEGNANKPLAGKQLAMIFEKPSTRTRASFEVGINQLGGNAIVLSSDQSQMGRGESAYDTANVLSRYVDIIMIRCFKHQTLLELAENSSVPVINGLTDSSHPCQVMADILTFEEHRGEIKNKTIAWIGDGNNMTHSWIHAAVKFGFKLNIATPDSLKPSSAVMDWAQKNNGQIKWTKDAKEAAKDADLVTTDTWVSMGDKDADFRYKALEPYQVNDQLMSLADKNSIFMHCLPAHRGDEVTESVIDGKQSVIFDEAENRLHIQKAIMIWCLKRT
ncbi:ornithine carbamoyltransferase [Rickettsiales bacterium]|nr:ornithine carbamoyltransferase [Rickettsiales bacterium]